MNIRDRIKIYIPVGEKLLAGIISKSFWGFATAAYVATEQRLGHVFRRGWFSWHFSSIGMERISRVTIDEGLIKCKIQILTDLVDKKTGELILIEVPRVSKRQGRHFVSVVTRLIDEHRDLVAYRTKTCPQCDEIVKWKASRCKYCGHKFI